MASSSQKRALQNYRSRLEQRGLERFEVLGRSVDRALIRSVARQLAEDGPEAAQIRASLEQVLPEAAPAKGGIVRALRRSPLVDANLDLKRPRGNGRKIAL